jgi:lysophospholipase L1-like esterase
MKGILLNVNLVVLSVGLSLLMGEVVLRMLGHGSITSQMYVEDEHTIYRNKPLTRGRALRPGEFDYSFTTNTDGFRGQREYRRPKPVGTRRVLAIGDSFTFGIGVDDAESYPAQLERRLSRLCASRPVQVVNAGVGGFGTSQQLVLLERVGLTFQPDLVVLGVFVNDPEDNLLAGLHYMRGDTLLRKPSSAIPRMPGAKKWLNATPGYDWLVTHSVLVNWLRDLYFRRGKHLQSAATPADTLGRVFEQDTANSWLLTERLLERMKNVVETHGSRFLVVLIPDQSELHAHLSGKSSGTATVSRLRQICRKEQLDCVDLSAWIRSRRALRPSALYFPPDGHFFNADGYGLLAEAVLVVWLVCWIVRRLKGARRDYSDRMLRLRKIHPPMDTIGAGCRREVRRLARRGLKRYPTPARRQKRQGPIGSGTGKRLAQGKAFAHHPPRESGFRS